MDDQTTDCCVLCKFGNGIFCMDSLVVMGRIHTGKDSMHTPKVGQFNLKCSGLLVMKLFMEDDVLCKKFSVCCP